MNVTFVYTTDYEENQPSRCRKNKPNQTHVQKRRFPQKTNIIPDFYPTELTSHPGICINCFYIEFLLPGTYSIDVGAVVLLEVNKGANGIDRTDRRSSRMSRMSVGLVNHPATNFNWQLTVANGCLNRAARPCGFLLRVRKGRRLAG